MDIFKKAIDDNDIICIVNPDNPTGSFIKKPDIIELLDEAKKKNKTVIFDESFIDFADAKDRYTLIEDKTLSNYPNLIVVKSISKSYGIPGIRLGVLATSNTSIIEKIEDTLPVWNINSYGEYFLQIANLYKQDYASACDKIAAERKRMISQLKSILPQDCVVYDSQANFILVNLGSTNSTELAINLLENNIFIKDLRTKQAFEGKNFIRLAIRTKTDNNKLLSVLKQYFANK